MHYKELYEQARKEYPTTSRHTPYGKRDAYIKGGRALLEENKALRAALDTIRKYANNLGEAISIAQQALTPKQ